jgi:hypothetical protein
MGVVLVWAMNQQLEELAAEGCAIADRGPVVSSVRRDYSLGLYPA